MSSDICPAYAPFFGVMGVVSAIVLPVMGAAIGTAKSGVGIITVGVLRPDLMLKNMVPVIMAGILGIYGLVVAVMIADDLKQQIDLFTSFIQLCSGLSVGLCCLGAGFAIGTVGDAGVRGVGQQPRIYTGKILILIFAEVLALYGLVIGLIVLSKGGGDISC